MHPNPPIAQYAPVLLPPPAAGTPDTFPARHEAPPPASQPPPNASGSGRLPRCRALNAQLLLILTWGPSFIFTTLLSVPSLAPIWLTS